MKRKWVCGILTGLLFVSAILVDAATIVTNDGNKIIGDIIEEQSEWIIIKSPKDLEIKIPRSKITSIFYENALYRKKYPVFGMTIGTPAALNLVWGYYFENYGIRCSGLYLDTVSGIQLNALRKLKETPNFLQNASILAGSAFTINNEDRIEKYWNYIGVGYDLNWYGFFFELDITVGSGSYSSPQMGLQIGYVHRYNKKKNPLNLNQ